MFAYCNNNPVNYRDDDGEGSLWVLLFLDRCFGFIHACVAIDIVVKYSVEKECWIEGMGARADIVSKDGSVWEIKTAYTGADAAYSQASKYIGSKTIRKNITIQKLGEAHAFSNSFYIYAGDEYYMVHCDTPMEGVILYEVFPGQVEQDEELIVYPYKKKNSNHTTNHKVLIPPVFVLIPPIPASPGGWGGGGAPWDNVLRPQIA